MTSHNFGRSFGVALCEHFGLPPGKTLSVEINDGRDEIFGATVRIALTADDLAGIAKRMGAGAGAVAVGDSYTVNVTAPQSLTREQAVEAGRDIQRGIQRAMPTHTRNT